MKGVKDSATRLREVLEAQQIKFEDHTGEPYRDSLGLDILQVSGEAIEGDRLWIQETVKPTVVVAGRVVRAGQVLLAAAPVDRE